MVPSSTIVIPTRERKCPCRRSERGIDDFKSSPVISVVRHYFGRMHSSNAHTSHYIYYNIKQESVYTVAYRILFKIVSKSGQKFRWKSRAHAPSDYMDEQPFKPNDRIFRKASFPTMIRWRCFFAFRTLLIKRRPIFLAYHTDTNILPERWTPTSVQTDSARARGSRRGAEARRRRDARALNVTLAK